MSDKIHDKIIISSSEFMSHVKVSTVVILNAEQFCSEIEANINSGNLTSAQVGDLNFSLNELYAAVLIYLAATTPIPINKIVTLERDVIIGSESNYSLNCGSGIKEEGGFMLSSFPIPDILVKGLKTLLRLQSSADSFITTYDSPKLLCSPIYDMNQGGRLYFLDPDVVTINSAIGALTKRQIPRTSEIPPNYFHAIQTTVRSLGAPW